MSPITKAILNGVLRTSLKIFAIFPFLFASLEAHAEFRNSAGAATKMAASELAQKNRKYHGKSVQILRTDPVVASPNIFGSPSLAAKQNPLAKKIHTVLAAAEHKTTSTAKTKTNWTRVLAEARTMAKHAQIKFINYHVNNAVTYRTDRKDGRPVDVWSPATETMKRAYGDCEDIAIVKLWLLEKLGFKSDDLHIVAVRIPRRSQQHAIMSVKHDSKTLILDNMTNHVLTDDQVTDYVPLYSVNTVGFWLHGTRVSPTRVALSNQK